MFPGLCWDSPTSCHPGCVLISLYDDDDDVQCECFSFSVWQMTGALHSTLALSFLHSQLFNTPAKCKPSFLTQDTHMHRCAHMRKVQYDYLHLFSLNVGQMLNKICDNSGKKV